MKRKARRKQKEKPDDVVTVPSAFDVQIFIVPFYRRIMFASGYVELPSWGQQVSRILFFIFLEQSWGLLLSNKW